MCLLLTKPVRISDPFKNFNSIYWNDIMQRHVVIKILVLMHWTKCPSLNGTTRAGYSHCSWFREDISMNVHHQIPTSSIFHYKANVIFGLETSKKVHQEGVSDTIHSFKYSFFTHQAANRKTSKNLKLNSKPQFFHSQTLLGICTLCFSLYSSG